MAFIAGYLIFVLRFLYYRFEKLENLLMTTKIFLGHPNMDIY